MIGLMCILVLVLFLPFTVKKVGDNLEPFLFVMGLAAALVSGVLSKKLVIQAVEDPIKITVAVLLAGLLFKWYRNQLRHSIQMAYEKIPFSLFLAIVVIGLGLLSSVITAIMAAIVLVLIVDVLPLDRKDEINFTVIACFAIGLGAVLTPIGEPLSTITISKFNGDFFYLLDLVGPYIIPGVIILGIMAGIMVKPSIEDDTLGGRTEESYREIIIRSVKIYMFVMGLTLLGAGFKPFINKYLIDLSAMILYWINITSSVLDNATLAAAEISPAMQPETVKAILLGLLISGGMLIPGNIPNIISAGKLNITSKQWARVGVPLGLILLVFYFVILLFA